MSVTKLQGSYHAITTECVPFFKSELADDLNKSVRDRDLKNDTTLSPYGEQDGSSRLVCSKTAFGVGVTGSDEVRVTFTFLSKIIDLTLTTVSREQW